jgi:radical SAM superfamily enzyme YgiQ (UPF0313 family)
MIRVSFNYNKLYSTLPVYEELYSKLDYVVLRTSWGCPFVCSHCAIKHLSKSFFRLSTDKITSFILHYYHKGIKDFVLYDDAFFFEREWTKKLLRKIYRLKIKVSFHTPNALHLKFLDQELAKLLKKTSFINPHFGLETLDRHLQKKWGNKVNMRDLRRGIKLLNQAGFKKGEFSFYLLLGYPGQDLNRLLKDIKNLHFQGARISLAEFSLTPQTQLFELHEDTLDEPLLHNNSVFYYFGGNKIKQIWDIKNYTRELNRKLSLI